MRLVELHAPERCTIAGASMDNTFTITVTMTASELDQIQAAFEWMDAGLTDRLQLPSLSDAEIEKTKTRILRAKEWAVKIRTLLQAIF